MRWRRKHFEKRVRELTDLCEEFLEWEGNVFEETPPTEDLVLLAFLLVRLASKREEEFVRRIRESAPPELKDFVEENLREYGERIRSLARMLEGFGPEVVSREGKGGVS